MKKKMAFMIHPRTATDFGRFAGKKIRIGEKWGMRLTPNTLIEKAIMANLPKKKGFVVCSHFDILGIAEGYIIAILLTGRQMRSLPQPYVCSRIMAGIEFAVKKLGVSRIGLGAYTAPMTGNGLLAVRELKKKNLECGITHGDSLSAYSAIPAIQETARMRGVNTRESTIAIVGAYGVTGRPIALLSAKEFNPVKVILTGPKEKKLGKVEQELKVLYDGEIETSTDNSAIREADVVVLCTTSTGVIVKKEILKKNAIVVDMAQPHNMSREVCEERPDVLRVDGGFMQIPGINLGFSMGPPRGTTFACLLETMLSCIRGEEKDRVGKVDISYAAEIAQFGKEEGFTLAPLTNFSQPLNEREGNKIPTQQKSSWVKRFAQFLL